MPVSTSPDPAVASQGLARSTGSRRGRPARRRPCRVPCRAARPRSLRAASRALSSLERLARSLYSRPFRAKRRPNSPACGVITTGSGRAARAGAPETGRIALEKLVSASASSTAARAVSACGLERSPRPADSSLRSRRARTDRDPIRRGALFGKNIGEPFRAHLRRAPSPR